MQKEKLILTKKLTAYLFYASVLIFLISFNFQDSKTSGWYQQWLPTGLGSINDMTFTDSLSGYIVSGNKYFLKTTNGGYNWYISQDFGDTVFLTNIQFLNKDSAILCEANSLFKTTNRGANWSHYSFPFLWFYAFNSYAFSYDSIYVAGGDGIHGGVYLTINGGINWTQIYQHNSNDIQKIMFINHRLGFCCDQFQTLKTTNGGYNWFLLNSNQTFLDMFFTDSLNGWKSRPFKTTDGGVTWIDYKPYLPQTFYTVIYQFSKFSKDTIWAVGGSEQNLGYRAIIYKTTNGGENWGYQRLDTSINIFRFEFCCFINKNNGWAYYSTGSGVHTITGGNDTTFYTNINNITKIPPKNFELKQNYPNPYNNSSLIEYYLNEPGWVKLKIFDMSGREMGTLVNEEQNTGGYGIPVSIELSSGVYFYKLVYINKKGELQTDTKKMVLIK